MRILAAVAAQLDGSTMFTGDASLCARPMKPLLDAVAGLGAGVIAVNGGFAPFAVTSPATRDSVAIRGDISSQFILAMLIASPLGKDELTIHLTTPLTSRPYVEMTIATMQNAGVTVITTADGFTVPAGQQYHASQTSALEATTPPRHFSLPQERLQATSPSPTLIPPTRRETNCSSHCSLSSAQQCP